MNPDSAIKFKPYTRHTIKNAAQWEVMSEDLRDAVSVVSRVLPFRVNPFGPPRRRNAELLVVARLDPYSPKTDASALTCNLVRRGLVRPFFNGEYQPGGLDITRDLHVVDVDGKPIENLWALGFPVEGPHFYTHALPRPLMNARFTQDAERCVTGMLKSLRRLQMPPREAAPATVHLEDPRLEKIE